MSGPQTLAARYAAIVCDLDGVVYRGPTAVPHAAPVPTLSEWAIIGLLTLLMLAGLARLRSHRR